MACAVAFGAAFAAQAGDDPATNVSSATARPGSSALKWVPYRSERSSDRGAVQQVSAEEPLLLAQAGAGSPIGPASGGLGSPGGTRSPGGTLGAPRRELSGPGLGGSRRSGSAGGGIGGGLPESSASGLTPTPATATDSAPAGDASSATGGPMNDPFGDARSGSNPAPWENTAPTPGDATRGPTANPTEPGGIGPMPGQTLPSLQDAEHMGSGSAPAGEPGSAAPATPGGMPGASVPGYGASGIGAPDGGFGSSPFGGIQAEEAFECPNASDKDFFKRITELTTKIKPPEGTFPKECNVVGGLAYHGRTWSQTTFTWKASGLCHKPLYFEDVQLERYGHSWGPYLQPVISAGHFFVTIPLLPYEMGLEPPGECIYSLGYYRPGNCAPYMLDPIPLSVRAGLFEATGVVGMAAILP